MDTGKAYYDTEGNECSIWQMVMREPHWAANRIQEGEKALEELARLRAELEALRNDFIAAMKVIRYSLSEEDARGTITDTLWVIPSVSPCETLFDFISAAVDAARGGK